MCCGFASICNKEPRSYSPTPSPSPVGWGEESEGKRQKLLGWDDNSLREWQREKKTTSNNTDKSIYNMQCSHHTMLSLLLSSKSLSFSQLPT